MAVAALLMGGNITAVHAASHTAMMINGVNAGYATATATPSDGSYLYNYQNPGNLIPFDNSNDSSNYTTNMFSGISIGSNTNIREGSTNYYSGLAIGNYAQATGGISFALGHYAQATAPSAMALGTATKASGFNSLAMMRQSAAEGDFSAALGTVAWAKVMAALPWVILLRRKRINPLQSVQLKLRSYLVSNMVLQVHNIMAMVIQ